MIERLWHKIGETAALVGATPKELRYWEKVIPELKPRRSKGNLRYYHQDELAKLQAIRQWLSEGFTVADCRELLRGQPVAPASGQRGQSRDDSNPRDFSGVLSALRALCARLEKPPGEASCEKPALPAQDAPKAEPAVPVAKRGRKPKPDASALGRMWSGGRLPLDWEE